MIETKRIGHATLTTTDLDRQIEHYTEVMGLILTSREPRRAFLSTRLGQLVLQIERGDAADCSKLSFEVAPNTDFQAVATALRDEGIASDRPSDSVPGIRKTLTFKDSKGTTIELFSEWDYVSPQQALSGVSPLKLGHVAFAVPDVGATADFYRAILGFRVSDWIGDFFVFMRCNSDHHTVNFIRGNSIRLNHIAFELKDAGHLQNSSDVLGHRQIPIIWGPLRHGPGHNVATYHHDADSHVVEFFCELDRMLDEDLNYFEPRPWHRDRPQRPKTWVPGKTTFWGPPQTPEFRKGHD
jgi:catechol 2,3-dioxygenase-like lactoylglutathione lyase family enzyme